MSKNILIISHLFYPSVDVGARRWTKFAEALKKNGYNIHLITSNAGALNLVPENIPNYISSRSIIDYKYPKILDSYSQKISVRVRYKIALNKVKKQTKGNYYDRGIFYEQELYQVLKQKLKEYTFEKVIVTGGPFSLLYYLAKWKNEFKYNLVSDIRDPWYFGETYGIKDISQERRNEEREREKVVINASDIISVPGFIMKEQFAKGYPNCQNKVVVIPHGYSEDEFSGIKTVKNDKFKTWIYGGTLYHESNEHYKTIFEYIEKNQESINLHIFSRQNALNFRKYKGVTFKELVKPTIFNQTCIDSDAFIWFFPEKYKDFFTTKLYELIRCQIPIVYVGHQGQFSEFIVSNNLGVFMEVKTLKVEINEIEQKLSLLEYNFTFPIEKYEVKNLVKLFLE